MKRTTQVIPKHVAFIMDGNRRWAKEHRYPLFQGHRIGESRIEPLIDEAILQGITHLTFWAFSTENWNRTKREVGFLLTLFRTVLNTHVNRFHQKNVKLLIIGDISKFPADIQQKIHGWEEKTKNNTKITVNIALSYGGRDEIIRAINTLRKNSKFQIPNSSVTDKDLEKYLDTAGQPDPDLMIRTGGEKRLSGYLLWQSEYTELYFIETYWPDFTVPEFQKALKEYAQRQRRFGA
jgi:undecaprenyl diphosphate synthase